MRILCIFLVLVNVVYFLWQMRTQENVVDLPADPATSSLVLLSELPAHNISPSSKNTQVEQPPEQTVPVETPPPTQGCIVLGGFVDQPAAEQAAGFLSEHHIMGQLHIQESQGADSFLVYLPPFISHAEALTQLRELKAKAIDSFIIADGERINGISLGVFTKEESAKKLQAQLKEKGYNASVVNSARLTNQYTVQIAGQPAAALTEELKTEISQKYAGSKLTTLVDSHCAE